MKHTPVDKCKMCHSIENDHRNIVFGCGVVCDNCLPKLRKIGNAAPDLLEACINALAYLEGHNCPAIKRGLQEAISKTEGED